MATVTPSTPHRPARHFALDRRAPLWLVPLGLVAAVLVVSPNFRPVSDVRSHPFGGDFLQEWVGGRVIRSGHPDRLYAAEYSRQIQHDPASVGFAWPTARYFPMVYPPFYYLAVSPLAALPYPVAAIAWLALMGGSFAAAAWALYAFYPPSRALLPIAIALCVLCTPLLTSLNTGQKSPLLLLILTTTFLLLYHRRPFGGGLVFGLLAFKPHLAVFIAVAMLFKGQWRFVAGVAATVGIAIVVSLWLGSETCLAYVGVCLTATDYVQAGGYQLSSAHGFWGAASLLLAGDWPWLAKGLAVSLTLLCIALVVRALRGSLDLQSDRFALQFSALVFATLVTSPHLYTYDLTVLLLPAWLVGCTLLPHFSHVSAAGRWLLALTVGLLFGAGVSVQLAELMPIQLTVVAMLACVWILGARSLYRSAPVADAARPPAAAH